jgi:hypothetical protein
VHPLPGHVMQPETASVTNDLAMSRYDRVSPRWAKSRASISPYSNNKLAIVTLSPCWLFNLLSTSYMTNLKDFFAKKPSVTDNSGAVFPQPLSSTMNPQQLLSRSLLQSVHRVLFPRLLQLNNTYSCPPPHQQRRHFQAVVPIPGGGIYPPNNLGSSPPIF